MATNSELIDRLARRCGSKTATAFRAKIVDEVTAVIDLLEMGSFMPWFLENEADLTTVASTRTVALPSDFLREVDDGVVYYQKSSTEYMELVKTEKERLDASFLTGDPGEPEGYALWGTNVYLGPTPDDAYTIKWPYYKSEQTANPFADNGNAVTNKWLIYATEWMLSQAGYMLADFTLHNPQLALRFQAAVKTGRSEFIKSQTARDSTNRDYSDADKYAGE